MLREHSNSKIDNSMRTPIIVMVAFLCVGCTLNPYAVQKAPVKPDQAVVFDIDGTLTPKPSAIYTARDDAALAVQRYADKGFKIIYLSARFVLFQANIPDWLKENHFPEGSIHVPQTAADRSDHAAFKKRILDIYTANGWKFIAAYGDSSTDFQAYAAAGIEQKNVYAIQRAGETSCRPGLWAKCFRSWSEQMDIIMELTQP